MLSLEAFERKSTNP